MSRAVAVQTSKILQIRKMAQLADSLASLKDSSTRRLSSGGCQLQQELKGGTREIKSCEASSVPMVLLANRISLEAVVSQCSRLNRQPQPTNS